MTPRSVTRSGHASLERLRAAGFEVVFCTPGKQPDEAELLRLLPGCVGYLAGVEKVSASILEAAKGLRAVSRNGVGVDNLDAAAAKRLGIAVLTTPGANSRGVAELTVGLLFALARKIPASDRAIKAGDWIREEGIELQGRLLGVVGCGQIGRFVAAMAAGIGMRAIGYDVVRDAAFRPGGGFRYVGLEDLLKESDAVTLHCPALPDGRPLLDGAALRTMKTGAMLVNTARASLVDEAAVVEALDAGRLAGYATDVYSAEPPRDRRLAGHARAICMPHAGGLTAESVGRAMDQAVDNLLKALE